MDYWQFADITYHLDFEEFLKTVGDEKIFISSTYEKSRLYTEVKYTDDCYIMFGKESAGLPPDIHEKFIDTRIKIPMMDNDHARSLNLANSVNIVLYEALRQLGFPNLK